MSSEQKHEHLLGSSGEVLVAAELGDFLGGSEIFVRGRKATCIRFDYPHVYWRFADSPEDEEKHRSFSASPHLFSVDPKVRENRPERPPMTEEEEGNFPPPPPPEETNENYVS
jgi:hypothetical protein